MAQESRSPAPKINLLTKFIIWIVNIAENSSVVKEGDEIIGHITCARGHWVFIPTEFDDNTGVDDKVVIIDGT